MNKKEARLWIPLYVDKWLYGSTREELAADEQAIWTDFLCLGAKDKGFIRANIGFPYSDARLAGLLGRPEELIHRTIEKCLKTWTKDPDEKPKLMRMEDGTLYITNWEEYQFNERYVRKIQSGERQLFADKEDGEDRASKTALGTGTTAPIGKDNIGKDNIGKDIKSLPPIQEIIKYWNDFAHRVHIPWIRGIDKGSWREKHLLARLKDSWWDIKKICEAIEAQEFLLGDNDRGWVVDFDWILNPANATKILEGSYTKNRIGEAARKAPESPYVGARRSFKL